MILNSELLGSKLTLKYKDGEDTINKGYFSNTKEEFGKLQYNFGSDFAKGEQDIEMPWTSTPILKTKFRAYTAGFSASSGESIGLRLLYDGGTRTSETYKIIDFTVVVLYTAAEEAANPDNKEGTVKSATNLETEYTTYNYAGHWDDPINPTWDLNFGICSYYFYNNYTSTTPNNMYNLHWTRSLEQIENGRILTGYFNLSPIDMETIRLNDRVWVKDAWWNILEIIDYNAAKQGLTKVKLITIDNEQPLNLYGISQGTVIVGTGTNGTGTVISVGPGNPAINAPVSKLVKEVNDNDNLIYTTSPVQIMGRGNVVSADTKNIIIQGDNNKVMPGVENVIVLGNEVNVSASNTINTPLGNIIVSKSLTRAELITLITTETLVAGSFYYITDRDIIMQATTIKALSNRCNILKTGASDTYYTSSGINKGVFNDNTLPTLSIGDIYVWGTRVWEATVAGTAPSAVDDFNLNLSHFVELTTNTYGIIMVMNIVEH